MRKVTIEFVVHPDLIEQARSVYEVVEYVRIIGFLNVNFEEATKAGMCEVVMREGHTLEEAFDRVQDYKLELLHVLKQEGRKYTILSKVRIPETYRSLLNKFNFEVIFAPPIMKSEERNVISLIGEEEDIRKFIEALKEHLGEIKRITFPKMTVEEHDMLSILTDRQREVMTAAMRYGYYAIPRKIGADRLSEIVGMSKSTLLEHLRKAESRLLSSIFAAV